MGFEGLISAQQDPALFDLGDQFQSSALLQGPLSSHRRLLQDPLGVIRACPPREHALN